MADLSKVDDEKNSEINREIGRREEQELQQERELATEKGRKQGLLEGRERDKTSGGTGTVFKILTGIVILAIIILVSSFLTLSVSVTEVSPGKSLPYTTMYSVSLPEGQMVTIGDTHINVLSYQNELISDIDGNRQKLEVGVKRVISERRAVITIFNTIPLIDTHFAINLKYKGDKDNRAYFDMAVHTSKQVPDLLIKKLIPGEMNAQTI
jgi:predicted transglutaminase-like protease